MSMTLRERLASDRLLGVSARVVGVLALAAYPLISSYQSLVHSNPNVPSVENIFLQNPAYHNLGSRSLAGMAVDAYLYGRNTGQTTYKDVSKKGTQLDSVFRLPNGSAASISLISEKSTYRDGLLVPDPTEAKSIAIELDDTSGNSQSISFSRDDQSDGPWTVTRIYGTKHNPDQRHEVLQPVGGSIDSITKFIMRGQTVIGAIDVNFDQQASGKAYNRAAFDAANILLLAQYSVPSMIELSTGTIS
ncbi:MAG TPA: hypothetical protein VLG47_06500 [Candidatus Saccharimonadales bacterium]|nr:hypothetical protein [Candidatus Saccharimonadales bacterium]